MYSKDYKDLPDLNNNKQSKKSLLFWEWIIIAGIIVFVGILMCLIFG